MKKLLILFLLASVMLSMCSGCTVEKTVESAQAVTVLKVIKPNYISDFTQNIAEFNEANPDIQVKFIDAPTSTEKRHQLYVSALSGKDSSIDIYWINDEWTKEFVEQKYIKALDGEILLDNSRYIIDAQERFSVNDSFYAMPVGMDTDVIFYRSDKIHNVPETRDGIINLCRNSDFGLPIKLGLTTSDIQDMMYNIIEIKEAMGISYAETLNLYKEFIEEYKDIENYTDTIAAFKIGSAAMLMGNSSLWKKLNGDTSAVKGNIMVASLPNKNQFVRSYALAINSNSKNQEAAIRFLDFMNGKEQQRRLSRDTSLIPIIRELYDDEMILDANPHVKGIKQSVQNSSSFATVSINGENLKKLEEALIKFFNNEETSMNTGKIFEDLMQ